MNPSPDLERALAVDGPVRIELFVLAHDGAHIRLGGPCGPAPWIIEATGSGHPMELAQRMARRVLGDVMLVHSTSWRYEAGGVVLTFTAVVAPEVLAGHATVAVGRAELARGGATDAPGRIDEAAVLEHGLRHLAWLVQDDDAVRDALPDGWRATLATYVPEPFRQLEVTA